MRRIRNTSTLRFPSQQSERERVRVGECRYFTYNDVNLVTTIEYPGGVANYFWYDAMMRRYAMQDSNGLSYFTWDQNGMNLLAERDSAGTVTAYYTHGDVAVEGIGSLVAAKQNRFGASYYQYPVYDHRGTVVRLVDENGTPTAYFEYDAWGNQLRSDVVGGISENRFRYQSNWIDLADSGGKACLSPTRIYCQTVGRLFSRDESWLAGGYQFPSQIPTLVVDPRGLAAKDLCCGCFLRFNYANLGLKRAVKRRFRPPYVPVGPQGQPGSHSFKLNYGDEFSLALGYAADLIGAEDSLGRNVESAELAKWNQSCCQVAAWFGWVDVAGEVLGSTIEVVRSSGTVVNPSEKWVAEEAKRRRSREAKKRWRKTAYVFHRTTGNRWHGTPWLLYHDISSTGSQVLYATAHTGWAELLWKRERGGVGRSEFHQRYTETMLLQELEKHKELSVLLPLTVSIFDRCMNGRPMSAPRGVAFKVVDSFEDEVRIRLTEDRLNLARSAGWSGVQLQLPREIRGWG